MASEANWFTSLFCKNCVSTKDEKKNEMDMASLPRVMKCKEKRPTVVSQLSPIKIRRPNQPSPNNKDLSSLPSKDNYLDAIESRQFAVGDTQQSTPRFDLELEVVESDYLDEKKKFRVKSDELVNGKEVVSPGRVYIGTETEDLKLEAKNDIVCSKFKNTDSLQLARLTFDGTNFFIKEYGSADGIYIKAEDKLLLQPKSIVYYGIGHFIVEYLSGNDKSRPSLKLKFMDGPTEGTEKIIEPDQICTFGRLSTCTVVFDEYGVSRIQCKLFFENGSWYIKDGDGYKKSTNGTWILLHDKKQVFDKMFFKISNTVFKATLISC